MDSETKQSQEGDAAVKPALRMQIESLRKLKTKRLKAQYRDLFGEESPSSNWAHLFRRIAWRLQANAEGDLSERVRERASELANDADLRLRAPREFWREIEAHREVQNRDPRIPPAGTVLERFYRVSISGKGVWFAQRDCASGDGHALERLSLLRPKAGLEA